MLPELVLDLAPGALVDLRLGECRRYSLVLQIAGQGLQLRRLSDIGRVEESRVDGEFKLLTVVIVLLVQGVLDVADEGRELLLFRLDALAVSRVRLHQRSLLRLEHADSRLVALEITGLVHGLD